MAVNADLYAPDGDVAPDRLLVFVHIPKTAGTTLKSILAHHYSAGEICKIMMRGMSWVAPSRTLWPRPLISCSKLRRFKAELEDPCKIKAIHGHFDLSLYDVFPSRAEWVTLLRDPVERAISHYDHFRRLTTDPAHELAIESSLAEWVSHRRLIEMDNGQTRRLAGELTLPIGAVTQETLAKAKANLARRFSVVGLSERFSEFQILLHRHFSWPYCQYGSRNVGNGRIQSNQVGTDVLGLIESCNRFDRELYEFACGRFEHAASEIDMKQELRLLRAAPEYVASLAAPTNRTTAT
jgi:hypothetical protein